MYLTRSEYVSQEKWIQRSEDVSQKKEHVPQKLSEHESNKKWRCISKEVNIYLKRSDHVSEKRC